MNTRYPNQYSQQQASSAGPGWILFCIGCILALSLIALPWMIIGMLTERVLSRWLHWRLSFFLWFVLFFGSVFLLYISYQHGLQPLLMREFMAYILTIKRDQTNFAHWPLHVLWADTFPVWMKTWRGIGIVGFCAELFMHRRTDTAQGMRQSEYTRQKRAQRSQQRAQRRSIRPGYVPDAIGGMMVMGIPLHDELEGE